MNIGDIQSVRCYDGVMRKGKIIYIHPDHIFAVFEFESKKLSGNVWRESILLMREALRADRVPPPEPHRKRYAKSEDWMILHTKNLAELGRNIGRTEASLSRRRKYIEEKEGRIQGKNEA